MSAAVPPSGLRRQRWRRSPLADDCWPESANTSMPGSKRAAVFRSSASPAPGPPGNGRRDRAGCRPVSASGVATTSCARSDRFRADQPFRAEAMKRSAGVRPARVRASSASRSSDADRAIRPVSALAVLPFCPACFRRNAGMVTRHVRLQRKKAGWCRCKRLRAARRQGFRMYRRAGFPRPVRTGSPNRAATACSPLGRQPAVVTRPVTLPARATPSVDGDADRPRRRSRSI